MARCAMASVTWRLCSRARAGCSRKRSSSRSISCSSRTLSGFSGISRHTHFSNTPISGASTMTVARRNRVFIRAIDTAVMVMVRKSKCTMALTV